MPVHESELIVFDGTCVLCSGFARFMAKVDRAGRFRFVTAQSATGQALYLRHGLDPVALETNIVIVEGRAHIKTAAFAAAMRSVGWPWRALAIVDRAPRALSDPVYDAIARSRDLLGRRACTLPSAALRNRLIE